MSRFRESVAQASSRGTGRQYDGGKVTPATWLMLAGGLVAAVAVAAHPPGTFLFNFVRTFIHEFGHTVACWFFAHPAAPSFNIATGGGMTIYDDRDTLLLAGIAASYLMLLFLYRRNRHTLLLLLGGGAAYALLQVTDVHEIVILLSGHGAELLVAGVLLYRVLGDRRIVGKVRRPAFAFTGCFILVQLATFSYQLLVSQLYRHSYEFTRGAGFEMDFTRIAQEYDGMDVRHIALTFFVMSLLVPLISFSCFHWERYLGPVRSRLGDRTGSLVEDAG